MWLDDVVGCGRGSVWCGRVDELVIHELYSLTVVKHEETMFVFHLFPKATKYEYSPSDKNYIFRQVTSGLRF